MTPPAIRKAIEALERSRHCIDYYSDGPAAEKLLTLQDIASALADLRQWAETYEKVILHFHADIGARDGIIQALTDKLGERSATTADLQR